MSNDLNVAAVIDLEGNFTQQAKKYTRDLTNFSKTSRRNLGYLRRGFKMTGRGLERMGNRYTSIMAGAAGVGAAKQVMDLEKRMTALGVAADISDEKLAQIKDKVFQVAIEPDIRVDPDQILNAIDRIVTDTGNIDVAVDSIESIALAISAATAEGEDIGGMVGNLFRKFDIKDADDMLKALDLLALQGKAGSFELKNMAVEGNEVMSAYAVLGRKGSQGLGEMGALLQLIKGDAATASETTTAFQALLREITVMKVPDLQKRGIKIFDPEQLKNGVKEFRGLPDIIKDIVRGTNGDMQNLYKVFKDAKSLEAFKPFMAMYNETGSFEALDKLLGMQGDGNQLMIDSARNAHTASASLNNVYTLMKKFADIKMSGPIKDLADAINELDPDRLMEIMDGLVIGAGALATFAVGAKAIRGIGSIYKGIKGPGKKGVAGALGGAMGGVGVMPVFVTNMGGLPGVGGVSSTAKGAATGAAATGVVARYADKAKKVLTKAKVGPTGAVMTAGLAGYEVGGLIQDKLIANSAFGDNLGSVLTDLAAALGVDRAVKSKEFEKQKRQKALLEIKIATEEGNSARVATLKSTYSDIDLDVDTGRSMTPGSVRKRNRSVR